MWVVIGTISIVALVLGQASKAHANTGGLIASAAPNLRNVQTLLLGLREDTQRIQDKLWAAAGSVDTDLSFLSFLELYGTEIAERRMPARQVVEALDVVEHI